MSITITAVPEPEHEPPRVVLTVTSSNSGDNRELAVSRTDSVFGRTKARDSEFASLSAGTWVGYDYEAPYGVEAHYDVVVDSDVAMSEPVTLESEKIWLIHPGLPALSMQLPRVRKIANLTRRVVRGKFDVVGRKTSIIRTDGTRKAPEYKLTLKINTHEQLDDLDNILDDTSPLLLNVPVSLGWRWPSSYISVDTSDEERPTISGSDPRRELELPIEVTERPTGQQIALWTCDDVAAEFDTCTDLLAVYETCTDLLTDTRRVSP